MLFCLFLLFALAGWLVLYRVACYIIFKPKTKRWPLTLPFRQVWLAPHLSGVYLPAQPHRPTLIFFHGRGGNISHFENFAKTYANLGYGVLMADYAGFGLSKGVACQHALEQAAVASVAYALNHLQIPPQSVVIYGHSLGNYPALFAAQHYKKTPLKALVLQSPFLSTPDMAATWAVGYRPHTLGYALVRIFTLPFLWGNRFDNTQLTAGLSLPVLVCMSKEDSTLPWQVSAKLADGLPHAKRLLAPSGGHDEFAWSADQVNTFLSNLT